MTMAEPSPPAPEVANGDKATIAKLSAKLKQLNDANNKYKNLLKLAKDRIQQQDEEVETLKSDNLSLKERLEGEEKEAQKNFLLDEASGDRLMDAAETNIVRVCQRVKQASSDTAVEEIWALLDMEITSEEGPQYNKKYKEWKMFNTESELKDFIRRDTGEPLTLPSYSLSSEQSQIIQEQAQQQTAKVEEEFRRFRVKSELTRKQMEAHIKELQNTTVQTATQQIESRDTALELEQAKLANNQLDRLKAEMAAQEAHWKESYETLLAENNALKSAGSEALLASQWRQRYENCQTEKEALAQKLDALNETNGGDAEKYQAKYRDLKESFRLYRKKAKEIFEAQQHGESGGLSSATALSITTNSSADAKLSYLKNLMLNYLTADPTVRDHMEGAIGTVLQFSDADKKRIDQKKAANDAWF